MRIFTLAIALLVAGASFISQARPSRNQIIKFTQPDGSVVELRVVGDEHFNMNVTADGNRPTVRVGDAYYFATTGSEGQPVSTGILACADAQLDASELAQVEQKVGQGVTYETLRANARMVRNSLETKLMSTMAVNSRATTVTDRIGSTGLGVMPCLGDVNVLVVLVEFSDVKFLDNVDDNMYYIAYLDAPNAYYTYEYDDVNTYFDSMFNEETFRGNYYTNYGIAKGSIADYFKVQSRGKFRPKFDVKGPYTLSNKKSYYGTKNYTSSEDSYFSTSGAKTYMMGYEALQAIQKEDANFDFAKYDNDNDGKIDNLVVIFAGDGAATSNDTNADDYPWPAAAFASYATRTLPKDKRMFGGVEYDRYIFSNESVNDGSYKDPEGYGTIVHEMGHALGLPDLYHSDNSKTYTALTPHDFSVMDIGCDAGGAWCPVGFSAYERYAIGWEYPVEMNQKAVYVLSSASTGGSSTMISNPNDPNEKYFFEWRTEEKCDSLLPAHGVLVWRLRYDSRKFASGGINDTDNNQLVDLIEADGKDISMDDYSGDTWPKSGTSQSFSNTTSPKFGFGSNLSQVYLADGTTKNDLTINSSYSHTDSNGTTSTRHAIHTGGLTVRGSNTATKIDVDAASAQLEASGIDGIVTDDPDAPEVYYNLQGIRVEKPTRAGLYIVRKGSKARKIYLPGE